MTIEDNKKYKLTGEQIKDLASRISILGAEADEKAEKALSGSTAPTTSTPGEIGQLYVQDDGTIYILKDIIEESGDESGALAQFIWEEFGAGTEYTAGDGIDITNDVIKATNTGKAKVLTAADYNYPTTGTKTSVALWLLPTGLYTVGPGVDAKATSSVSALTGELYLVQNSSATYALVYRAMQTSTYVDVFCWKVRKSDGSGGSATGFLKTVDTVDNLTSTSTTKPLSAYQGKVLNERIGDLTNLTTTDKTNLVAAINEAAAGGGGPTVVQTTGTSTTDVMSQNAVTSMVFADPATQYKIKIGAGTSASEGNDGIEIGHNASATKVNATALGTGASATGNRATAIGQASNAQSDGSIAIGGLVRTSSPYAIAIGCATEVRANAQGAIAIGDNALATVKGQFDISTLADGASSTRGYNSSPYRLLTGLYDPQSAHDAATKGYVDNSLLGKQDALTAGSGISIADESGSLVISTTVAEPDEFTSSEWNALWS